MPLCNGTDRGSNFALTRKAVAGPYLRSDAGKLGETALLQFSALVSAMGWINDMMLAKGLRRLARPVSVARYFSRA